MNAKLNAETWKRLICGAPLDDLHLAVRNGRPVLDELKASDLSVLNAICGPLSKISLLGDIVVLTQVSLASLEFEAAQLKNLRFFNCDIQNCIFRNCSCQGWRLWKTRFIDTTFDSTDIRNSALGGVQDNEVNSYYSVQFIKTDMRQSAYVSADFVHCQFQNSRLDKVNFGGSKFTDCLFEGELKEVCFNRHAHENNVLPPNEMLRVDFSDAKLRSVEFRELDLDHVRFPNNLEHILLSNYRHELSRIIQVLGSRSDSSSRKLAAYLAVYHKWAGPNQRQGVLNRKDLLQLGGADGLRLIMELLRDH